MDILIFDIDGVLIDVTKSYRETIRQTVRIYLKTCLGFNTRNTSLVSDRDISLFKSAGGFNNDWDLTTGLLLYLLSFSPFPSSKRIKRFSSIAETVLDLRKRASNFSRDTVDLVKNKDLPLFVKKVKSLGGGLRGVRRTSGGLWDGWIYGAGDLNRENLVKRIFQELYLGTRFAYRYNLQPLFYRGKGLYLREKLLIPRKILSSLSKKIKIGIASGRPRFEAEIALRRFHILSYFKSVVTLDECMEEEARIYRSTGRWKNLSKPHPYSLLRVVREIGIPHPKCGYVGDVVDDILAAKAAKKKLPIAAIGFLSGGGKIMAIRKSLIGAGADFVVSSSKNLFHLVLNL